MSHKRVSQLVELTSTEVQGSDLFYAIDISAREGKKLSAASLANYLAISGSLFAPTAGTANTASYAQKVLGGNVDGIVNSATTAVSSSHALRSNVATTASFAITASHALNVTAGSSVSSSWASSSYSSSVATIAQSALTAGFLLYTGLGNGTASYAIVAQNSITSDIAKTASYITLGGSVESASYAGRAGVVGLADTATTAAELTYPNTSTASYAITVENFSYNHFIDYGIFLATSQSITSSQLDLVQISSSTSTAEQTDITAFGTVIVPYTSSVKVDESLSLVIKNRDTGTENVIDSIPVYFDVSRTVNNWDSLMTGSLKIPYSLAGSASMYGDYMISVSGSSDKITIEPTRINRFNLSSFSNNIVVSSAEYPSFNISPSGSNITWYTGSHVGPFISSRDVMISSGSNNIESMEITSSGLDSVRYIWSLPNLKSFNCRNNIFLTSLGGMPNTMVTLSCDTGSISSISSLVNTTMSYFNCGNNNLTSLPALPTSLSYLNCTDNSITSLPTLPNTMSYLNASSNNILFLPINMPFGLTELYLNDNGLTTLTSNLPSSLLTMSVANNSTLTFLSTFLPISLKRFEIQNSPIGTFTLLPPSLLYLDVSSCSLSQTGMDNICSQSYSNSLWTEATGSLYLRGNGEPLLSTVTNYINPLIFGSTWTIEYDGLP